MRLRHARLLGVSLAIATVTLAIFGDGKSTASEAPAVTQAVSMVDFAFQPDPISIPVGTSVQWANATSGTSSTPHTTTSDTGLWDSGTLNAGQTFSITFKNPGTFTYHCTFHQSLGMTGTITVIAPTSTPTRTPTRVVPLVTLTPEAYLPEVPNVPAAATPSPVVTPSPVMTP
jgi:plastocyanin